MEGRHISVTPRPSANSKARRAEKDVSERKVAPKRSNSKKDASNTIRARDSLSRQQQLPEPRQAVESNHTTASRHGGRLRSPSLPAISEANHQCPYNCNGGPKTACPSIATSPCTTPTTTSIAIGFNAVQGLRESNEALLELVTELIQMIPSSFPVHEMIRRREEARALADKAPSAAAVVDMQQQLYDRPATTTTPSLPLLEGYAGETARKSNFAKGNHPRSKSSVF